MKGRWSPGDSGELEEMTNDVGCQLHFLLDRQHLDLSSLRFSRHSSVSESIPFELILY